MLGVEDADGFPTVVGEMDKNMEEERSTAERSFMGICGGIYSETSKGSTMGDPTALRLRELFAFISLLHHIHHFHQLVVQYFGEASHNHIPGRLGGSDGPVFKATGNAGRDDDRGANSPARVFAG